MSCIRLVLLLQGMAQYSDQLLTSYDGRPGSGNILGSAMSVGLVAKKFWNKLVHVQQTTQQLQFEVKDAMALSLLNSSSSKTDHLLPGPSTFCFGISSHSKNSDSS